jgi:uncharacterized protein YchJ
MLQDCVAQSHIPCNHCVRNVASGHTVAAPPSSLMNSRRLIRFSSSSYVGAGFILVLL